MIAPNLATATGSNHEELNSLSGMELLERWLKANDIARSSWVLPDTKKVDGLFLMCSDPGLSMVGEGGVLGQTNLRFAALKLPFAVISHYMIASACMSLEHHLPDLLAWFPADSMGSILPDAHSLRTRGYHELHSLFLQREQMFNLLLKEPVVAKRLAEGLAIIRGGICPSTGTIDVHRLITRDVDLSGQQALEQAWAHVPNITHRQPGLDVLSSLLLDNHLAPSCPVGAYGSAAVVQLSCMDPRKSWKMLLGNLGLPFVNLRNPGSALTAANMEAIVLAVKERGAKLIILCTHDGSCAMHSHALSGHANKTPLLTSTYLERDARWRRFLHRPEIASRVRDGNLVAAKIDLDLESGKLNLVEVNCADHNRNHLCNLPVRLHVVH